MPEDSKASLRGCRALIVDDDAAMLRVLERAFRKTDCAVDCAKSVEEAFARLGSAHYDVCLVDVRLANRSGEEVLARALTLPQPPPVLMMSGMATVDLAVRAMRMGAADFFEKPVLEEPLFARIGNVVESNRVKRQLEALTAQQGNVNVVAASSTSPAMLQAMGLAERVASTPSSSALLIGESGVGKEVLASHIHRQSARAAQPFVRVNVAAIPESMIEAELFGSVRGAFTDSKQSRMGYIASADRGTLLLDEIGELRADYQPKLLRALEERRFFPMGSDREKVVDVRFLAATNRHPEEMVSKGILRRDLFYRLGVVVRIPPLRERKDEILPLARHFLAQFGAEFGRPALHLTPAAEQTLLAHRWPGNIRELRNVIERAVMIAPGEEVKPEAIEIFAATLSTTSFPAVVASRPPPAPSPTPAPTRPPVALPEAVRAAAEELERQRIVDVLRAVNGSRSRAATTLGVSRSTLYEKLKRYAIE